MPFTLKSKLPRLAREFYQGRGAIFWTHTMEARGTGWLNESFHREFREVLLHTCGRYAVDCPCYVLMPDHWHLVWLGLNASSDQQLATAFLGKNMSPALGAVRLQDRAHDRILRESERLPEAFQSASFYVFNNARRANLCADWREWPYLGAMIMGYPNLDPRAEEFWTDIWKIHNRLVDRETNPCAPAQGYNEIPKKPNVARPGWGGTAPAPAR